MEVNFNQLRRKILGEYNELIKKLNGSIVEDYDMSRVIIPIEDLRRLLDRMRDSIITIGCLEEKGNADCQCILSDKTSVDIFAPREE
jgi:hypothetical protein